MLFVTWQPTPIVGEKPEIPYPSSSGLVLALDVPAAAHCSHRSRSMPRPWPGTRQPSSFLEMKARRSICARRLDVLRRANGLALDFGPVDALVQVLVDETHDADVVAADDVETNRYLG